MNDSAPFQKPVPHSESKPIGTVAHVKVGLLAAVGPLAIAFIFLIAWVILVPAMEWTATGYKAWNAALTTRLGVTLGLFLVELPIALTLGTLLSRRGVNTYWSAGVKGATIAACISVPSLVVLMFSISLASRGHNAMSAKELVELVRIAIVVITKEVAAGASCGVIAAASVRRSIRQCDLTALMT